MDFNSNYRMFYCRDPQFFRVVMAEEPGPYEFKIHLFYPESQEANEDFRKNVESDMLRKLEIFEAKEIKTGKMPARQGEREKDRVTFIIEKQDQAMNCYEHFITQEKGSASIYYIKPGKSALF